MKKITIINQKGFTLVELGVVLSILATLLGLATFNLMSVRENTSLSTAMQVLVADLKQQQIKAMIGDTDGIGSASAYGVHFNANNYVLFKGTYNASSPNNRIIAYDNGVVSDSVNVEIIFANVSGELTASNAATLGDQAGPKQQTVRLNRYGVIESVE